MEMFVDGYHTFAEGENFEKFWNSVPLKTAIPKLDPLVNKILSRTFSEIQELGIELTNERAKQAVGEVIDLVFKGIQTDFDELREVIIESLITDKIFIYIDKEYFKGNVSLKSSYENGGPFGLMRDGLFYELGLRYPEFHISFSNDLDSKKIQFKINDQLTQPFIGLDVDQCLVNDTVERLTLVNIKGTAAINPANGTECSIISAADAPIAEEVGLTTWDSMGYLVLCLSSVLRNYGQCFVNNRQVQNELNKLATAWPRLVDLLRNRYSLALITKTLRLLVSEEVSIRNLRLIAMSILEMDTIKTDPRTYIVLDDRLPLPNASEDDREDAKLIAEFVRSRMKEYISHKYTRGGNTLIVYLLDPEIEGNIEKSMLDKKDISDEEEKRIITALDNELGKLPPTASNPVILTVNSIRSTVKKLIEHRFPRLAVVAYNELSPTINIQPIGRITMH